MKPLIDCDILFYEIGVQGQYVDEEGNVVKLPFDEVAKKFDEAVAGICTDVWATEAPLLVFSHNKLIHKQEEAAKERKSEQLKKRLEKVEDEEKAAEIVERLEELKPTKYDANFREKVAKVKVYKGNRTNERPLHFMNLVRYAQAHYETVCAKGLEADDLLAVIQLTSPPGTTIICSRDKDLKQIPGNHYGWESGKQRAFGPEHVKDPGYLKLSGDGKKLSGTGLLFFYAQVLTGDVTDNYPGCPKVGPKKAYELLFDKETEEQMFYAVLGKFQHVYQDEARERMLEQAQLAWMIRELNEDGSPKHWVMYDERATS